MYKNDYFYILVNGKRVFIDYSDFSDCKFMESQTNMKFDYSFKFHYSNDIEYPKNVYPMAPQSFFNWDEYNLLSSKIKYSANSNLILSKQKPYAGAAVRRREVQNFLKENYPKDIDIDYSDPQKVVWNKIQDCLVSICVPGATNNMLDRGQLQYMGLGCCTISPELPELLPYMESIVPGIHYVKCKDDYSDLDEKIKWCKDNKTKCRVIGAGAKSLFLRTCTPKAINRWIREIINEYR